MEFRIHKNTKIGYKMYEMETTPILCTDDPKQVVSYYKKRKSDTIYLEIGDSLYIGDYGFINMSPAIIFGDKYFISLDDKRFYDIKN